MVCRFQMDRFFWCCHLAWPARFSRLGPASPCFSNLFAKARIAQRKVAIRRQADRIDQALAKMVEIGDRPRFEILIGGIGIATTARSDAISSPFIFKSEIPQGACDWQKFFKGVS